MAIVLKLIDVEITGGYSTNRENLGLFRPSSWQLFHGLPVANQDGRCPAVSLDVHWGASGRIQIALARLDMGGVWWWQGLVVD